MRNIFVSKVGNKLDFFLIKELIFWIIVIVVFYKNKLLFAMVEAQKGANLLNILANIRLDL